MKEDRRKVSTQQKAEPPREQARGGAAVFADVRLPPVKHQVKNPQHHPLEPLLTCLREGRARDAARLISNHTSLRALVRDPSVKAAVQVGVIKLLGEGEPGAAVDLLEGGFGYTRARAARDSAVKAAVRARVITLLSEGFPCEAVELLEEGFGYTQAEAARDPAVRAAVEARVIKCLREGDPDAAVDLLKERLGYTKAEAARDPAVKAAVRDGVIKCLREGDPDAAVDLLKERLGYTKAEAAQDGEVKAAVKAGVIKWLSEGGTLWADELVTRRFGYTKAKAAQDAEVKAAVKAGVIRCLSGGSPGPADRLLKSGFGYTKAEAAQDAEVKAAVKVGVIKWLKTIKPGKADELLRGDFGYTTAEAAQDPEVKAAAMVQVGLLIGRGEISGYDKFSKFFQHENVDQKVQTWRLAARLQSWFYSSAKENALTPLTSLLPAMATDCLIKPSDIVEATGNAILTFVGQGWMGTAEKVHELLPNRLTGLQILEASNGGAERFNNVFQKAPQFKRALDLSPQLGFLVCVVEPVLLERAVEQAPFLLRALEANPKYGAKLLVRYATLDEIAQEKIRTLYEAKAAILEEHPEIKPNTWAFREKMQERLKSFSRNEKILSTLKEKGVDIAAWLNHGGSRSFILSSQAESVLTSQQIATPLNRVRETVERVADVIKEGLKQEAEQLSKAKIKVAISGEERTKLEARVGSMKEAQQRMKNEGKDTTKIDQGIANFEAMLSRVEELPLYPELTGQVARFEQLKEELDRQNQALIAAEEKLTSAFSEKDFDGDKILDLKRGSEDAKREMVSLLKKLDARMSEIFEELSPLLEVGLGKESARRLSDEIKAKLAEDKDHFDVDKRSISDFLKGAEELRESLSDHPMSIFVWARDPDVDLYCGNYSPCCVSIEGPIHEDESPIADYITDLGMQVVHIWDEARGHPVAAVWLFIGENEKGETALVVDNIEANTGYSGMFPTVLQQELFAHLTEYARALNVDKLVLGKSNNDIPTPTEQSKLRDEGSKGFAKLGGYNGRGDGYYLEGESQTVKLIWERGDDKDWGGESKPKRVTAERRVKKVQYSDISLDPVSSDTDFLEIARIEAAAYPADLRQGEDELSSENVQGGAQQFSFVAKGTDAKGIRRAIGYLLCERSETDEGRPTLYVTDIAVSLEAQGQGLGWQLFEKFVKETVAKARVGEAPGLIDLHMRAGTVRMLEKHQAELVPLGLTLHEDVIVVDYYGAEGDAVYRVYAISVAVPEREGAVSS